MSRHRSFLPKHHGKSGLYVVGGGGGGTVVHDYTMQATPTPLPADGTWWSFIGSDGSNAADTVTKLNTMATKRSRLIDGVPYWHDGDKNGQQNPWNFENSLYSTITGHAELAPGGLYKSIGETWARAASGDSLSAGDGVWDARWVQMFANYNTFVLYPGNSHRQNAYTLCRPFHEFNGDWNNNFWSVKTGEEANFQAAYTRFRNIRDAHAPSVKIGLSCNGESSTATPPNLSACIKKDVNGHAVDLDYLSVDLYDAGPRRGATAADFNATANGTKVVNGETQPTSWESWRQYALALNLPLVISEWSNAASLGEAPGYLDGLYAWLKLHGGYGPGKVWMEALFNVPGYGSTPGPWGDYMLWDTATSTISGNQPLTAQHYFDIWGT